MMKKLMTTSLVATMLFAGTFSTAAFAKDETNNTTSINNDIFSNLFNNNFNIEDLFSFFTAPKSMPTTEPAEPAAAPAAPAAPKAAPSPAPAAKPAVPAAKPEVPAAKPAAPAPKTAPSPAPAAKPAAPAPKAAPSPASAAAPKATPVAAPKAAPVAAPKEAPAAAPKAAAPAAPASAVASTQADKLIDFAKSLIGKVHYGYGKRVTSNPNNMLLDCSSFTQYVYKQALGVKMGWGANAQHNAFPHVAKADLRKGDLVFFSVSNPSKIGHVGIYMGEGKFIHNVNPKSDVVISDLTTGYWNKHYIDGARPLK